jgi:hypothetical protein
MCLRSIRSPCQIDVMVKSVPVDVDLAVGSQYFCALSNMQRLTFQKKMNQSRRKIATMSISRSSIREAVLSFLQCHRVPGPAVFRLRVCTFPLCECPASTKYLPLLHPKWFKSYIPHRSSIVRPFLLQNLWHPPSPDPLPRSTSALTLPSAQRTHWTEHRYRISLHLSHLRFAILRLVFLPTSHGDFLVRVTPCIRRGITFVWPCLHQARRVH